jgi:hypothetical protein
VGRGKVLLFTHSYQGMRTQAQSSELKTENSLTMTSPKYFDSLIDDIRDYQPLIAANSKTTFVLLHTSYPYMREAGYLTAMYKNVYLDIGEAFPTVSSGEQEAVMRQVLELTLAPTNKDMWSSEYILALYRSSRDIE